ncbi:diguanylate cyclase [Massilia sp. CCM 8734]|uniref:GGDEF domain-containing protein n=1 Tax=Massilia sp. CCM 8734 TaxID=2609283 RepID=UPI001422B14C|nr:diguanylate cyclase [Massilia sp. CCM 8734]NHZ94417.1 diguanylate cyclase [Massilia sp. CCM 8734]
MAQQIGLFLNPVGQRRVDFQGMYADMFARLFIADGSEQATVLLGQERVDLLIIDLERFDRSFDLDALGELIARRAGAPVLILCPFSSAGWLPALMKFGPLAYAITPLDEGELRAAIGAQLQAPEASVTHADDLRALLALRTRLQQALVDVDDLATVAEQICVALCDVSGAVHASLFRMDVPGDLQLEAQYSPTGLNLARVLHRSDRLLQSPLRHAFPGLVAACSNEMCLLDAPAKAGEPELALSLVDKGVDMVVGLPLGSAPGSALAGSLCLMFGRARQFSTEELDSFVTLAQLAGFGLRMAAVSRENEALLGRVTHMATVDALTGVANRRHGEHLLELEIKRARRYKVPAALIGFDIDRFKAINDQFGHPVGDAALRTVAAVTQAALRTSDVLIRSGGEEFLIIVPHTSAIDALKIAEKIRVAVAQTDIAGCDRLTISLGVAQLADQESADSLMLRVDAALSRAKRAGRNCVELAMS